VVIVLFKHFRIDLVDALLRQRAMREEPESPMHLVEICRSVWQQSVALFNELWEQELINNFNYCLQQH